MAEEGWRVADLRLWRAARAGVAVDLTLARGLA